MSFRQPGAMPGTEIEMGEQAMRNFAKRDGARRCNPKLLTLMLLAVAMLRACHCAAARVSRL